METAACSAGWQRGQPGAWEVPCALSSEWPGEECEAAVSGGSIHFPIQNLRLRAGKDPRLPSPTFHCIRISFPRQVTAQPPITHLQGQKGHYPRDHWLHWGMALKFFLIWSQNLLVWTLYCTAHSLIPFPSLAILVSQGMDSCPVLLMENLDDRKGLRKLQRLWSFQRMARPLEGSTPPSISEEHYSR